MPLFEYTCRACGHKFEYLTRANHTPRCPSCSSIELEKQLSVFAVGSQTPTASPFSAPAPCGACGDPRGPGACTIN